MCPKQSRNTVSLGSHPADKPLAVLLCRLRCAPGRARGTSPDTTGPRPSPRPRGRAGRGTGLERGGARAKSASEVLLSDHHVGVN
eukprot:3668721-Prymnesium_polylepis.1